ncbi:hypothetical protein L596_000354 [Steinernema carpocapsae]|uniref:Uncharacterized protein n=1 Tax=Steinernema carpocapsae TaxID=34508 RepID=A0A4U8UII7_STECR|nr:hypothetical protein L596_000354 [Steinernema carpocapsae]
MCNLLSLKILLKTPENTPLKQAEAQRLQGGWNSHFHPYRILQNGHNFDVKISQWAQRAEQVTFLKIPGSLGSSKCGKLEEPGLR